jgi:hypothetical protein
MRKPAPKSNGKPDEPATVDDNLIPGIPDTLENVARALVKTPPKKPHEWKFIQKRDAKKLMAEKPDK